jgi:hypothetical protein
MYRNELLITNIQEAISFVSNEETRCFKSETKSFII